MDAAGVHYRSIDQSVASLYVMAIVEPCEHSWRTELASGRLS
jgi:hypothetical protein